MIPNKNLYMNSLPSKPINKNFKSKIDVNQEDL